MRAVIRYKNRLMLGLLVILTLFCAWQGQAYLAGDFKILIERRLSLLLDSQVSIDQVRLKPAFPFFKIRLQGIRIYYKNKFHVYLGSLDMASDLTQLTNTSLSGTLSGAEVFSPSKAVYLADLSGRVEITRQRLILDSVRAKFKNIPLKLAGQINNPADIPEFDLNIQSEGKEILGLLTLKGGLDSLFIGGFIEISPKSTSPVFLKFDTTMNWAGHQIQVKDLAGHLRLLSFSIPFTGRMSLGRESDFSFVFKPPEGEIYLDGRYNSGQLEITSKIRHIRIYDSDLVCDLSLQARTLAENNYGSFEGQLNSFCTILNHRPFSEFESQFIVNLTEKNLLLKKLVMAGSYCLAGELALLPPHYLDLSLDIKNAPMDDVFLFVREKPEWRWGERFDGSVKINGPLLKPFCKGKLTAGKGKFKGEVPYDSIEINPEGTYPVLELVNSRIYRKEGPIAIVGAVDFTKKNPFQDISLLAEGNIVWKGWDIKREPFSDLIEFDKDIGEDLRIGLKAYLEDEARYNQTGQSEMELELKLKDHQSLKMRMRDDEELLGLEHKISF